MSRNLLPSLLDRAVVSPRLADRLFEDTAFDRWFDDALMQWPAIQSHFVRPLQVRETDDEYVVRCELPGYGPDEVIVELSGDALTIRGEQGGDSGDRRSSFTRSIRLGVEVDRDAVDAELKNGVLSIRLPKSENVKPRRIQVRASSTAQDPQLIERRTERQDRDGEPVTAQEPASSTTSRS